MAYEVEVTRYSYGGGESTVERISTKDAIVEALERQTHGWGHDTTKNLEDRLDEALRCNAALISLLLDKEVLRPDDIQKILGWRSDLKGEIVKISNGE